MPQIPAEYLGVLGAAVAGYLALVFVLRFGRPATGEGNKSFRRLAADRYFNVFLTFVLGWKLSPLVFQTSTVLASPSALLYLPGGFSGSLLGLGAALGYLIWVFTDPRKQVPSGELPFFRKVLGAGVGTLLLTGAGFLFLVPAQGVQPQNAPDFTFTLEGGKTLSLKDLRGKPTVLNFWASWCPPCRAEFPEMAAFQETWGDKVFLLAVNAASTEKNPSDAGDFLRSQKVNFPVAYDGDGSLQRIFQVTVLPTTVVIDPQGRVVWRRSGAISSEMLSQVLQQKNQE